MTQPVEPVRLSKRVAGLKGCSRSEAERYIEGGWVTVDGTVVESPAFRVAVTQAVVLDPEATLADDGPVTFLLHKPAGQDTWDNGAGAAPRLLDARHRFAPESGGPRLLQRQLAGLQALAVLPREAAGLVVYTQDWRVARKLTEDAGLIEHEVMADVAGAVQADQLQRLRQGLSLQGRPLPAARVSIGSADANRSRLRFAVKGIAPDQIPALCEAVGLRLLALTRQRIGRVALNGMPEGQWRFMLPSERF